jgi:hypothetical protein
MHGMPVNDHRFGHDWFFIYGHGNSISPYGALAWPQGATGIAVG